MFGRQISPVAIGFPTYLGKGQLLGTYHSLSPGNPAAPRCEATIQTAQRGRGSSQLGTGWGSDSKSFPVTDTRQQRDNGAGRRIWKRTEQLGDPPGPGPPNSEHVGFQGKEEVPKQEAEKAGNTPITCKMQPAYVGSPGGEGLEAQTVAHQVQTFSSRFPVRAVGRS